MLAAGFLEVVWVSLCTASPKVAISVALASERLPTSGLQAWQSAYFTFDLAPRIAHLRLALRLCRLRRFRLCLLLRQAVVVRFATSLLLCYLLGIVFVHIINLALMATRLRLRDLRRRRRAVARGRGAGLGAGGSQGGTSSKGP